jgi:hypothetical protein
MWKDELKTTLAFDLLMPSKTQQSSILVETFQRVYNFAANNCKLK